MDKGGTHLITFKAKDSNPITLVGFLYAGREDRRGEGTGERVVGFLR